MKDWNVLLLDESGMGIRSKRGTAGNTAVLLGVRGKTYQVRAQSYLQDRCSAKVLIKAKSGIGTIRLKLDGDCN